MLQQDGDHAHTPETVLLVETDHQLRRVIAASLELKGLRVLQASDTGFAMRLLEREDPELMILDLNPSIATEQLVQAFLDEDGQMSADERPRPILITTLDRPDKQRLQEIKPEAVIYKPFDVRYLYRRVMESLQE
jgi:DNA-binding response OmpR family regulator